MTIVVGAKLPSAVFITADSRATFVLPDKKEISFKDDVQKVYSIPPILVGLAGDASVGSYFVKRLSQAIGVGELPIPDSPFELESAIQDWCCSCYDSYVKEYSARRRFALIIAFCDHKLDGVKLNIHRHPISASVKHLIKAISGAKEKMNSGFVLTIEFPQNKVSRLQTGSVALIGSGSAIDGTLENIDCLLFRNLKEWKHYFNNLERDRDEVPPIIEYGTYSDPEDILTFINARILYYQRLPDSPATINPCMHGYILKANNEVKPWGSGCTGYIPKLFFGRSGMIISCLDQLAERRQLILGVYKRLLGDEKDHSNSNRLELDSLLPYLVKDKWINPLKNPGLEGFDVVWQKDAWYILHYADMQYHMLRDLTEVSRDSLNFHQVSIGNPKF